MYMMFQKLKNLFIPSPENGYKPNFLERMSAGIMLVLILLTFALANLQALLWIGSDWMSSSILPAVIVDLTNEERGDQSLQTLRRNSVLDEAARLKAEDMAKYEYFAHYSPTGVSPWHWFDEVAYDFVHAGENLAVHFTDSGEVVEAWMESPSHRANILNSNYIEIGVGTAKGSYKGFPTIFVVQLFGTPALRAEPVEAVAGVDAAASKNVTLETVAIPAETNEATTTDAIAQATFETLPKNTPKQAESNPVPVPVLVPTSTEPLPDTTPIGTQESPVTNEATQQNESVVMYSDLATTSRPGIPASVEDVPPNSTPQTTVLERTMTQSSAWLQILYGILAFIVIVALILSIVIEWRKQNPLQIAYAGGLLAVMALLFHIHTTLTSGVTII